jgi:hypothetical protein
VKPKRQYAESFFSFDEEGGLVDTVGGKRKLD